MTTVLLPLRSKPSHLVSFCVEHRQVYAGLIAPQARETPSPHVCAFCSPIKVGTRVGCTYREPPALQPWLHKPHRGTVLDLDDPRVWEGSLAFPNGRPTREQVRAHLARCVERGGDITRDVAIAWDFGRVYWERAECIFPAAEVAA